MTLRVFISYSRSDEALAAKLRVALEAHGYEALSDQAIRGGRDWMKALAHLLSYAHVVVALITKRSRENSWLHEEVGYAFGLNLPVVCLTAGTTPPKELLGREQVISISPEGDRLPGAVATMGIESIVSAAGRSPTAMRVEIAREPDKRHDLLIGVANQLSDDSRHVVIRKRTRLSSFSLPKRSPRSKEWSTHYGSRVLTEVERRARRDERIAMEAHARAAGCRLILCLEVDDVIYNIGGPSALLARLGTLCAFLRSMPDNKVEVALSRHPPTGTVTLFGDYAQAEALMYGSRGYLQTLVTWHAPTIRELVAEFDDEFRELAEEQPVDRAAAIHRIEEEMEKWRLLV